MASKPGRWGFLEACAGLVTAAGFVPGLRCIWGEFLQKPKEPKKGSFQTVQDVCGSNAWLHDRASSFAVWWGWGEDPLRDGSGWRGSFILAVFHS